MTENAARIAAVREAVIASHPAAAGWKGLQAARLDDYCRLRAGLDRINEEIDQAARPSAALLTLRGREMDRCERLAGDLGLVQTAAAKLAVERVREMRAKRLRSLSLKRRADATMAREAGRMVDREEVEARYEEVVSGVERCIQVIAGMGASLSRLAQAEGPEAVTAALRRECTRLAAALPETIVSSAAVAAPVPQSADKDIRLQDGPP